MKELNLYFMRHGKTVFNEKDIVQGWCDSLLTKDAIKEAELLKDEMKQLNIDTVYTSPMLRARQTANCVCPWVKPIEDTRLMEIHYGYLEGESAKTLQLFYPKRYDFENFEGFAGGESWQEAGERLASAVTDIIENAKDQQNILIVSHGAIITWFLHQIDSHINKKIANLAYIKVVYDDSFHIE